MLPELMSFPEIKTLGKWDQADFEDLVKARLKHHRGLLVKGGRLMSYADSVSMECMSDLLGRMVLQARKLVEC